MNGHRTIGRVLLHIVFSALITLLASVICYKLDIPNPVIVLVIFMIIFTVCLGSVSGAVSAVCIVIYALFYFSEGNDFITFSSEAAYKCFVVVISLAIIYIVVALLRRRTDHAFEKLIELNNKLKEQNRILEDESDHDALSGIYNRRGGDKRVAICLSGNADSSFHAILAAIDIDNFKQINDVYGHAAGDRAIQILIERMQEAFGKYCILIRNGGDEFQAFLYGEDITEMEQTIVKFSDENFHVDFEEVHFDFHVSCGYAFYPDQADSMSELYRKADIALYDVKMSGKHKALPYTWEADTARPEKLNLSVTGLSNYLPVAFMVYRADDTEEILIASASLLRLCGCNSFSELVAYTGGSFRGFVHPDDVDRVEKSIEEQIERNPQKLDEVDYCIITKDGRTVRIHDLGRRINDPGLGELFYVAINDKDATEEAKKI